MRRISLLVVALGVAAVLAGLAGAAARDTKIALVAYSTPKEAFSQLIPAFQATAGREGRHVHPVLRRLGRPGARGRRRPPRRRRRLLARARRRHARQGRPRRQELEQATRTTGSSPTPSSCSCCGTGNPKHIKTWDDLDQAGRPGRDPEPVHLGRRALERHGRPTARSSREGKTPEQASAYLEQALPQRRLAGHERAQRAADVPRRQGRRPARPTRTRRSSPSEANQPVYYLIPKATILIENPAAVTKTAPPRRRRPSSTACARRRRRRLFGQNGLPPGRPEACAKQVQLSRRGRSSSRSTYVGGWDKVTKQFFDPKSGDRWRRSSRAWGCRLAANAPVGCRRRGSARGSAGRRSASASPPRT